MPYSTFISYSHYDRKLRNELEKHLSNLKRQHVITSCHDGNISPGTEWKPQIITHLNTDQIILLLISADFMASDFCYSLEMMQAIARHDTNQARVLPIILRPTDWKGAPFDKLKVLPTDGKAITRWPTHDEAFENIVQGIREAIDDLTREALRLVQNDPGWLATQQQAQNELSQQAPVPSQSHRQTPTNSQKHAPRPQKTKEQWLKKGTALCDLKWDEEALAAYEQALSLDPNDADAYIGKGAALNRLKRYEEALAAFEQALSLDPNVANACTNKGIVLCLLKRYEEALATFEQALSLDPNDANAYALKSIILEQLGKKREAQKAYNKEKKLGYSG